MICSICFDTIVLNFGTTTTQFSLDKENDFILNERSIGENESTKTKCGHVFHTFCLKQEISKKLPESSPVSCPECEDIIITSEATEYIQRIIVVRQEIRMKVQEIKRHLQHTEAINRNIHALLASIHRT